MRHIFPNSGFLRIISLWGAERTVHLNVKLCSELALQLLEHVHVVLLSNLRRYAIKCCHYTPEDALIFYIFAYIYIYLFIY